MFLKRLVLVKSELTVLVELLFLEPVCVKILHGYVLIYNKVKLKLLKFILMNQSFNELFDQINKTPEFLHEKLDMTSMYTCVGEVKVGDLIRKDGIKMTTMEIGIA
ncbi:hypothetical protein IEQ34_018443 [Dendrobium chrysotoxum]|uniref:Uncharacterized protein n=1 Tax=Dendrobium chrysotoxum TaxID=161865 RepID=A0AAV7G677_DENCH|nr:hypothetical protein IEQ34_018443 [Dendrobium chrysotoxum]